MDLGIAKQNMIGMVAGLGLSREGYNVITTTFAPFPDYKVLRTNKSQHRVYEAKNLYGWNSEWTSSR